MLLSSVSGNMSILHQKKGNYLDLISCICQTFLIRRLLFCFIPAYLQKKIMKLATHSLLYLLPLFGMFCVCICAHVHVCVCRLILGILQLLSTLVFEMARVLLNPEVSNLLDWLVRKLGDPSVTTSPVLGLQAPSAFLKSEIKLRSSCFHGRPFITS